MTEQTTAYKPRRIKRNPIPQLPRYFKTMLWKDLMEKMKVVEHICFIIVQNGEVNNVYIKTIQKDGEISGKDGKRVGQPNEAIQTPTPVGNQPGNRESDIQAEEALHQNLQEPPVVPAQGGIPTQDDEIPEEETTELPPETPAIPPKQAAPAIKPPDPIPTPPKAPEAPEAPKAPQQDQGTEVQPGHRIKAIYENTEVKGTVERVLREAGRPDEFITILDSGRKVILEEKDLVSLLVTEK